MEYLDNPGNGLVKQTLRLAALNVGYTSALKHPEQLHPRVYAESIAGNVNHVLLRAEQARLEADSYRGFKVGAAAMAVYRHGEQMRKMYVHGANAKPVPGSDIINVHAEHTIFTMVEEGRMPHEHTHHVPLVAIIGDLQPDQQSGTCTHTLHPCGICRQAFFEEKSPIQDDSLIVTATADFRVVEWFSRRALMRLHEHDDDSGIGRVEFDERHPMLIQPVWYTEALRNGTPVTLADHDTAAEREYERDYNARVRYPIFNYVLKCCNT